MLCRPSEVRDRIRTTEAGAPNHDAQADYADLTARSSRAKPRSALVASTSGGLIYVKAMLAITWSATAGIAQRRSISAANYERRLSRWGRDMSSQSLKSAKVVAARRDAAPTLGGDRHCDAGARRARGRLAISTGVLGRTCSAWLAATEQVRRARCSPAWPRCPAGGRPSVHQHAWFRAPRWSMRVSRAPARRRPGRRGS